MPRGSPGAGVRDDERGQGEARKIDLMGPRPEADVVPESLSHLMRVRDATHPGEQADGADGGLYLVTAIGRLAEP